MAALPDPPSPARIQMSSFTPTLVSTAQSMREQVRQIGAQRWAFRLLYPPVIVGDEARDMQGFLLSLAGQYTTFTFSPINMATPRGIATGTPLVMGAGQSGTALITDGWTISQTGIMKRGDIFTIAGDLKVYMVTADANSDGSGVATLSIFPALMISPADNAVLTVNNVNFTVALTSDAQGIDVFGPMLYSLSLSLMERV